MDRLNARTKEVEKLSQDILSKPINFDENEELILENPKLKAYPKTKKNLEMNGKNSSSIIFYKK